MTLTYKVPPKLRKPFVAGQFVEVCDRNHDVMSVVKVVYAGKRIVRLNDGRTFRATDGWYVGLEAWPFPSIRHPRKKAVRA